MRRTRVGAWLLLAAPLLLVAAETIAAAASPGYDYARDFISDLGVPGPASAHITAAPVSPLAGVMLVGFALHALLLLAVIVLLPLDTFARACLGATAIGFTAVVAFPFSASVLAAGLLPLHEVGTAIGIAGGVLFSWAVARTRVRIRWMLLPLGTIAGVCAIVFAIFRQFEFIGLVERGAIYAALAAEIVVAVDALVRARRR